MQCSAVLEREAQSAAWGQQRRKPEGRNAVGVQLDGGGAGRGGEGLRGKAGSAWRRRGGIGQLQGARGCRGHGDGGDGGWGDYRPGRQWLVAWQLRQGAVPTHCAMVVGRSQCIRHFVPQAYAARAVYVGAHGTRLVAHPLSMA